MTADPASLLPTLADLKKQLHRRFQDAGIESAAIDARFLMEGLSGLDGAAFVSAGNDTADATLRDKVERAMALRISGMPVHRILGRRAFYGLDLFLSAETLEPRPDTETLVEAVLPFVRSRLQDRGVCRICDLGTGSGAIGLALVAAAAGATCLGIDRSQDAVDTANANARRLGLDTAFEARAGNWLAGIAFVFDLIVSNPPYIPSVEIAGLPREVRDHDPRAALDGGNDGLDPYREIAASAGGCLAGDGRLAFETGAEQGEAVRSIAASHGFAWLSAYRDLGGHERVQVFGAAKMRP